jgi:hypothetical protein
MTKMRLQLFTVMITAQRLWSQKRTDEGELFCRATRLMQSLFTTCYTDIDE